MKPTFLTIAVSILFLFSPVAIFHNARAIEFDRSLSLEQRHIIQRDLENLCRLNYDLRGREIEMARRIMQLVFEIEEINCHQLKSWLGRRVQWIIGDFDFRDRVIIQREEASLINSLAWSWFYFTQQQYLGRKMNDAHAMNFGGHLVQMLQRIEKNKWFYSYEFGEFETWFKLIRDDGRDIFLPITTPRVGIVSVSDHFFLNDTHPDPTRIDSLTNSFFRIGLLLHEARHNDGHGEHTFFLHNAPCNKFNSTKSECDNALNGTHGVEFTFLKYASLACDICNEGEKSVLALYAAAISELVNQGGKLLDTSPVRVHPRHSIKSGMGLRFRQLP